MKRILVATDGSDGANRALDEAAGLAKTNGAALILLTIGGTATGAELRRLADSDGDLSKTLERRADRILAQAVRRARKLGIASPVTRCEWGDPAEAILDVASREKVDAIVLGRRGKGPLTRLLMGSVSQEVTSLAPCIVVVVP